jgi:hypothetical protein
LAAEPRRLLRVPLVPQPEARSSTPVKVGRVDDLLNETPETLKELRAVSHADYIEWGVIEWKMNEGVLAAAIVWGERFVDWDPERALRAWGWIEKARLVDAELCNVSSADVDAYIEQQSPGLIAKLQVLAEAKPAQYARGLANAAKRIDANAVRSLLLCPTADVPLKEARRIAWAARDVLEIKRAKLNVPKQPEIDAIRVVVPTVEAPAPLKWSVPLAWLSATELLVRVDDWRAPDQPYIYNKHEILEYAIWNWRTQSHRKIKTKRDLSARLCDRDGALTVWEKRAPRKLQIWRWREDAEYMVWSQPGNEARDLVVSDLHVNPLDCTVTRAPEERAFLEEWTLPNGTGRLRRKDHERWWELCHTSLNPVCTPISAGKSAGPGAIGRTAWSNEVYFLEGGWGRRYPIAIAVLNGGERVVHHVLPESPLIARERSLSLSRSGPIVQLSILGYDGIPRFEESGTFLFSGRMFRLTSGTPMQTVLRDPVSPDGCSVVDVSRRSPQGDRDTGLVVLNVCSEYQ